MKLHIETGSEKFRMIMTFLTVSAAVWMQFYSFAFSWYFPGMNEMFYYAVMFVPVILCAAVLRCFYRKTEKKKFIISCAAALIINIIPAFGTAYSFIGYI